MVAIGKGMLLLRCGWDDCCTLAAVNQHPAIEFAGNTVLYTAIYGLYDPCDGALRYIGRTHQPPYQRLLQHCSFSAGPGRVGSVKRWVNELRFPRDNSPALRPAMEVLMVVSSWDKEFWERTTISELSRRVLLLNRNLPGR